MKNHFKHETGYMNIDESNIYFTISGNWQETKTLEEKSVVRSVKNFPKMVFVLIVMIILLILIFIYVMMKINSGGIAVFGLISIPLLTYKVITYLRADMSLKFYIPFYRIIDYNFSEDSTGLTIQFYNKDEKVDLVKIKELEKSDVKRIRELLGNKNKKDRL